jgi:cobalamin biosynthesis protein CobW
MRRAIPVTVVSGFLGSGKTTLLCDLLRRRQDRRLAVLINELGEVSIDGELARGSTRGASGATAEASGVEIIDFPSGLIAYADDAQFVPTLETIAARAGQVDHVLIETSGVAVPTAVMARLQEAGLAGSFVLDATLVGVDTPRLLAGEFDGGGGGAAGGIGTDDGGRAPCGVGALGEFDVSGGVGGPSGVGPSGGVGASSGAGASGRAGAGAGAAVVGDEWARAVLTESVRQLFDQQLRAADVVVLNKIDDLDSDALLAAEEQVRMRAPNVRFLELARDARLDVRVALGLRLHQAASAAPGGQRHFHGPFAPMPAADGRTLSDHSRMDGHCHSGLIAHAHGLATHTHFHEQDPGWLSFTLRSRDKQSVGALRTALQQVAETEPLLRCKGFALGSEGETPVLLQGVRARVVATEEKEKSPVERSELVFIGYHLSRARVAAMLSRLTGTAWS